MTQLFIMFYLHFRLKSIVFRDLVETPKETTGTCFSIYFHICIRSSFCIKSKHNFQTPKLDPDIEKRNHFSNIRLYNWTSIIEESLYVGICIVRYQTQLKNEDFTIKTQTYEIFLFTFQISSFVWNNMYLTYVMRTWEDHTSNIL